MNLYYGRKFLKYISKNNSLPLSDFHRTKPRILNYFLNNPFHIIVFYDFLFYLSNLFFKELSFVKIKKFNLFIYFLKNGFLQDLYLKHIYLFIFDLI